MATFNQSKINIVNSLKSWKKLSDIFLNGGV